MSKPQSSCYNCSNQRMCYIHKFLLKEVPFDVNHQSYSKIFNNFFITVGETCAKYEFDMKG